MPTNAYAGPGFQLSYEDPDVPGVFIPVAQCRDIDGPEETTEFVDITNQDSSGGFRERAPTLQDGGTVTFDVVGDPGAASQRALADLKHNKIRTRWRVTYPESTQGDDDGWVTLFAAYVSGWKFSYPYGDVFTRTVTLQVDGPVEEVAPGSGSGS